MNEELTPPSGRFGRGRFAPGKPADTGEGGSPEAGSDRRWSVRPGVVAAVVVAAVLITFVVQNGNEVPVTWLFVEVNGPLWAVIIVAAVAGAVLSEIIGWVVGRSRRRRKR